MRLFNFTTATDDEVRRNRNIGAGFAILWTLFTISRAVFTPTLPWLTGMTFLVAGLSAAVGIMAQLELRRRDAAFHARNAEMAREREEAAAAAEVDSRLHLSEAGLGSDQGSGSGSDSDSGSGSGSGSSADASAPSSSSTPSQQPRP